jgi:hypothetical protein
MTLRHHRIDQFIASSTLALACVAAACLPLKALAWGNTGHQAIATLAQGQLTAHAQAQVVELLALEPGATLASIATWADEHRSPATAPWHYVNFPRGTCVYDAARDCPHGACVVAALEQQTQILASDAPAEKRLMALKYVVHFMGDIHQPLHAGYADDKGGNTYQVQAWGRGTHLHAVWDSGLIDHLDLSPQALAEQLATAPRLQKDLANASPVAMAEASCSIVGQAGFYPDRIVGDAYAQPMRPVLLQRLAWAGQRLATLLNRLWP